jgi:hypothetical protein
VRPRSHENNTRRPGTRAIDRIDLGPPVFDRDDLAVTDLLRCSRPVALIRLNSYGGATVCGCKVTLLNAASCSIGPKHCKRGFTPGIADLGLRGHPDTAASVAELPRGRSIWAAARLPSPGAFIFVA